MQLAGVVVAPNSGNQEQNLDIGFFAECYKLLLIDIDDAGVADRKYFQRNASPVL